MKRILFSTLVLCACLSVSAQSRVTVSDSWYVGINPLSYAMAFPLKEEFKRFGPIASGNEYGFNVVGSWYMNAKFQPEARLSLGSIHQVASVKQFHLGINYHLFYRERQSKNKGLYAGLFLKYWDYGNKLTDVHFFNVSPYAAVGHQWNKNRWMFDLRLNQTIAVHSWTSLEDTQSGTAWFWSPWPEYIAVLPTVNLTIGYRITKSQRHH